MAKQYDVVSLFSGCGGMDLGFRGGFEVFDRRYERLPFRIVWANDLSRAACRTYKKNIGTHIHEGDIWDYLQSNQDASVAETSRLPEKADLVLGGFPCQDISINGKRAGVRGKRSGLYRAMVEVVRRCEPKLFVAENVKGLLMRHSRSSLRQVVADFEALGYRINVEPYLAANYGVPQARERVFIVGTRNGRDFEPPEVVTTKSTWMTAAQAINDLSRMAEKPEFNHIWSRARKSPEQGSRKLQPDRPAQTIRAECHGNIQYHYSLPRRISMREAARFQSFPDDFVFDAGLRETERMIGNAVPPVLAWHVAGAVLEHLTGRRNPGRSRPKQQSLLAQAV